MGETQTRQQLRHLDFGCWFCRIASLAHVALVVNGNLFVSSVPKYIADLLVVSFCSPTAFF